MRPKARIKRMKRYLAPLFNIEIADFDVKLGWMHQLFIILFVHSLD